MIMPIYPIQPPLFVQLILAFFELPPRTRGTSVPAPATLSSAEVAMQKAAHDEQKCLFDECNNIDTALHNLLTNAIDDNYLLAL